MRFGQSGIESGVEIGNPQMPQQEKPGFQLKPGSQGDPQQAGPSNREEQEIFTYNHVPKMGLKDQNPFASYGRVLEPVEEHTSILRQPRRSNSRVRFAAHTRHSRSPPPPQNDPTSPKPQPPQQVTTPIPTDPTQRTLDQYFVVGKMPNSNTSSRKTDETKTNPIEIPKGTSANFLIGPPPRPTNPVAGGYQRLNPGTSVLPQKPESSGKDTNFGSQNQSISPLNRAASVPKIRRNFLTSYAQSSEKSEAKSESEDLSERSAKIKRATCVGCTSFYQQPCKLRCSHTLCLPCIALNTRIAVSGSPLKRVICPKCKVENVYTATQLEKIQSSGFLPNVHTAVEIEKKPAAKGENFFASDRYDRSVSASGEKSIAEMSRLRNSIKNEKQFQAENSVNSGKNNESPKKAYDPPRDDIWQKFAKNFMSNCTTKNDPVARGISEAFTSYNTAKEQQPETSKPGFFNFGLPRSPVSLDRADEKERSRSKFSDAGWNFDPFRKSQNSSNSQNVAAANYDADEDDYDSDSSSENTPKLYPDLSKYGQRMVTSGTQTSDDESTPLPLLRGVGDGNSGNQPIRKISPFKAESPRPGPETTENPIDENSCFKYSASKNQVAKNAESQTSKDGCSEKLNFSAKDKIQLPSFDQTIGFEQQRHRHFSASYSPVAAEKRGRINKSTVDLAELQNEKSRSITNFRRATSCEGLANGWKSHGQNDGVSNEQLQLVSCSTCRYSGELDDRALWFCRRCQVALCASCVFGGHASHVLVSYAVFWKDSKRVLAEALGCTRARTEQLQALSSQLISVLNDASNTILDAVETEVGRLASLQNKFEQDATDSETLQEIYSGIIGLDSSISKLRSSLRNIQPTKFPQFRLTVEETSEPPAIPSVAATTGEQPGNEMSQKDKFWKMLVEEDRVPLPGILKRALSEANSEKASKSDTENGHFFANWHDCEFEKREQTDELNDRNSSSDKTPRVSRKQKRGEKSEKCDEKSIKVGKVEETPKKRWNPFKRSPSKKRVMI